MIKTFPDENKVYLTGRPLAAARLIWILIALAALTVFLLGAYSQLQVPLPTCVAPDSSCSPFTVSREDLDTGQRLGLDRQMLFLLATLGLWFPRLGFVVIAFLIFWRKSADLMALLVSVMLIVGTLEGITEVGALLPLQQVLYDLSIVLFVVTPFMFPSGRFVPGWTLWFTFPLVAAFVAATVFPAAIGPVSVVWFAGAAYAVLYRFRHFSSAVERQQTKWVMTGLLGTALAFVPAVVVLLVFPPASPTPERLTFIYLVLIPVYSGVSVLLPISIGVAIFRYRLWDVDLVINRALVYGALSVIVVTAYILLVGGLGYLFQSSGTLIFSLPVTGLIALVFQPLRERLQQAVNRLLYGDRDDPVRVLTRLGERLDASVAPAAVLPVLAEAMAQALRLPYVAVRLTGDSESSPAAEYGRKPANSSQFDEIPLTYQSEVVGQIIVSPRAGEGGFASGERTLLQNIARQVGMAAHAAQLTRDLQRSRERLVNAREEERRRLRRDLHDGIGPTLASQALALESIEKLITHDPIRALALTNDLKGQTRDAVLEIRRIIHDLRPPALDDLGLLEALREAIARLGSGQLTITLEAPPAFPPLPAAVETAVYRVAVEAVTNVLRHARALNCRVRLSLEGGLRLEVVDDGVGLPADFRPGVGFHGMRERTEELGGTFSYGSSADGTNILVTLPVVEAA